MSRLGRLVLWSMAPAMLLGACGDMRDASDRWESMYADAAGDTGGRDVSDKRDVRADTGPTTRSEVVSGDVAQAGGWPPKIAEETDSVTVAAVGGHYELLGGSVKLLVPTTTFSAPTKVTVKRTLYNVDGNDLVGYIWGPHMVALDPAARVTVRVPKSWIPPEVQQAADGGLLAVTEAHGLEALPDARLEEEGDTDVVYSADLPMLQDVVIGKLP